MHDPKKVLLVGTSFSAAPLFFLLKKHGFHVSVCGGLESDPCHQYADESYIIDYSKKENLLNLVQIHHFDYLIPSCNDFSYLSCAWVAEKIGFAGYDSYETSLLLHTKSLFRTFTQKNALPVPKSYTLNSTSKLSALNLSFPVLVKPIDSFSGKGVSKIFSLDEIPKALQHALKYSKTNDVVIEEFIDGTLHSHSAWIKNQTIISDVFVDEYCSVYPYQVDCSSLSYTLDEKTRKGLRDAMQKLVKLLKLKDGLLHTQFMVQNDRFWIIETMRRCPGDLYAQLIELSTGIPYGDLFARSFIDLPLPDLILPSFEHFYARHTISLDHPIIFGDFTHLLPATDIRITPLKNSGEKVDAAPQDKIGIIFANFGSERALCEYVPRLASYFDIHGMGEIIK